MEGKVQSRSEMETTFGYDKRLRERKWFPHLQ